MTKIFLTVSLFAGLLAGSVAHADTTYNYNYYGVGISGSGQTTIADTDTDGQYLVTSITGTANGSTVQGLLPANTYMGNDNLFYGEDPFLDAGGVSFSTTDGSQINIYNDGEDYYFQGDGDFQLDGGAPAGPTQNLFHTLDVTSDSNVILLDSFTFSPADVTSTPEPSGLVLLGSGVLALAGVARRRLVKA